MQKPILLICCALTVCVATVRAAAVDNSELALGEALPLMMGPGVSGNPSVVYPVTVGSASVTTNANNGGVAVSRLSGVIGGEVFSQNGIDYYIGDFCSRLPVSDPDEIDWNGTYVELTNSPAYHEGRVLYIDSTTNVYSRILFTRAGGSTGVKIRWVYSELGRQNHPGETSVDFTYTIGEFSSGRPHRLYWTSSPYSAPPIDLSGAYVRMFGDPKLFELKYKVDNLSCTSNVVQGVYYDEMTKTLQALANNVGTKEKPIYEGPEGEFVLVYYRDGSRDDFVGAIVVQVRKPENQSFRVCVGNELRPKGDGWNVRGLKPVIQKGLTDKADPEAGAYVEYGTYTDLNGYGVELIHAIRPNAEENTQGDGESPKVEIIWEAPDFAGTLWPFEDDVYQISWDPNMPCFAIGTTTNGLPLHLPNSVTAQLCKYQDKDGDGTVEPCEIAHLSDYTVRADKSGRFTVKFVNDDCSKVWYQSFHALYSADECIHGAFKPQVPVGREILPLDPSLGGAAKSQYARIDRTLGGYIYRDNSPGTNWNARLYHEPAAPQDPISSQTTIDDATSDDPFAALESAIYPVAESDKEIEVWWRGRVSVASSHFGTLEGIILPVAVTDYKTTAPDTKLFHSIVLASELGSAGLGGASSKGSLVLDGTNSCLELAGDRSIPVGTNGLSVSFWVCPLPGDCAYGKLTPGRLFEADFGFGCSARLEVTNSAANPFAFTVASEGKSQTVSFALATNRWTSLVFTEAGGVLTLYAGETEVTNVTGLAGWTNSLSVAQLRLGDREAAAVGIAFDDVRLWNAPIKFAEIANYWGGRLGRDDVADGLLARWGFEPDGMETRVEGPVAANGVDPSMPLVGAGEMIVLAYGAPVPDSGIVYRLDDVEPEVYRQTDASLPGYKLNLNHAFARLQTADDGYVTWAVRNDLGGDNLVFTLYNNKGRGGMATYAVKDKEDDNKTYSNFLVHATAANLMVPPKPLCFLDDYWSVGTTYRPTLEENYPASVDDYLVYRDRKGQDWARCAGVVQAYYHYKCRDTFDAPNGLGLSLTHDTVLPWMSCAGREIDAGTILNGTPQNWAWKVSWPDKNEVPKMSVAETLTKAKNGLPEVWNMASCAVTYPTPTDVRIQVTNVVDYTNAWTYTHRYYNWSKARHETVIKLLEVEDYNRMDETKREKLSNLTPVIATDPGLSTNTVATAVDLIDPTVAQTSGLSIPTSLEVDYGFTVGNAGTCRNRNGKWYFSDLPPSISDRFYIDSNAAQDRNMVLVGKLVEPATGNAYLQLNVLAADERQAIKDICKGSDAAKAAWAAAVDRLATETVFPNTYDISNEVGRLETRYMPYEFLSNGTSSVQLWLKPAHGARDHYALVANGTTNGWVTLIENDSTDTKYVNDGDPISMKILYVEPKLYNGTIRTLTDPLNKLSEKLTVQYNEPFGAASTNFTFQWRRRDAAADGDLPTDYANDASWPIYREGKGLTSFLLGANGTSLAELVNKYYVMRYRAEPGTEAAKTVGTNWCAFTEVTLAEGWVQRVLNSVTPFAQRIEDFYSNPSDIAYTMFEQIGRPYTGDVALNNDNLNEVGLIELYQTILNKAESMSLTLGIQDVSVNKQLLQAASRLADLYMLLGAEAYSDAKNPLISQGFDTDYLQDLMELPSTTFCFQNQLSTLLDEELALLRGRAYSVSFPNMKTQPCFNRLLWNFTKGVTEGEVAYVNNYGIRGIDGVIDVDCAAKQYPQGHGDAWGHYLSAIKGYYHLLRNPYFGWTPSMMEMMVSQSVVNEDYTDEQKFADAAVKLVQTGLDAVDLTARKAWRDNGGDLRAAYFDAVGHTYGTNFVVREGFGYGEWASRTCQQALYSWAVVNSVLPTNAAPAAVYADKGISQITRTTATQLTELGDLYRQVEDKANDLDSGLNPLGLSQQAIPMDIDPAALADRNSHFDQILERAEKALANCETTLAYAAQYGSRLRMIENKETEAIDEQAEREAEFNRELIAIYGTPYAGDIGVGGTYEQGYEGPDLYHYMYMDLAEFGLTTANLRATNTTIVVERYNMNYDASTTGVRPKDGGLYVVSTNAIEYTILENGLVAKPDRFGVRATEGSVQSAYRDYLAALVKANAAQATYQAKIDRMWQLAQRSYDFFVVNETRNTEKMAADLVLKGLKCGYQLNDIIYKTKDHMFKLQAQINGAWRDVVQDEVVVGMAVGGNELRAVIGGAEYPVKLATYTAEFSTTVANENEKKYVDIAEIVVNSLEKAWDYAVETAQSTYNLQEKYLTLVSEVRSAGNDVLTAIANLSTAEAAYRAEIAKGQQLQNEREAYRQRASNTATQYRYQDMFDRVQRNNALTKYSTSFDTAQRYVWELAKVYDYETGLLSSDAQSGEKFLAEIVGSRQLGVAGLATSSATDRGLYDIVHRMKENWSVLKGRLGVNNPDETATEFSLRYELFRIRPDATGDAAWRQELKKHWVDDLSKVSDFTRYCQPLQGANGEAVYGAALVIPFPTSIYTAENFFGKTLQGGDHAFSSADYATKIHSVGISFEGYDALAADRSVTGLAANPNVYLVPAGRDYLRAPAGTTRKVLAWNVVDQVLPLPYTIGSTELDDVDWVSTFQGLDGSSDSAARIRRHSTLRADGTAYSTRLVGRSVWNDRWVLIIPASELSGVDATRGLDAFINGVSDIKLKIRAYARSGN